MKKNRILLLTWFNNNNYGSLLQATALQDIINNKNISDKIKLEGFECKILNYEPNPMSKKKSFSFYFNYKNYKNKILSLYDKFYAKKYNKELEKQNKTFRKFIKNNISLYPNFEIKSNELEVLNEKFDIFISGSDQIWNPNSLDENYLLRWVNEDNKKISYGSSLSSSIIPEYYYQLYKKALSSFYKISTRDKKCVEQLEKIIGKQVTTVVDPVILLGRENIENRMTNIDKSEEEYCLSYFLGRNYDTRSVFKKFCLLNNIEMKSIVGVQKDSLKYDKDILNNALWDVDPYQFLAYIKNAKYIFTDSFHGTVLSIIFHKDFIVFEKDSNRPEQNNRIIELLKSLDLLDRWKEIKTVDSIEHIKEEKWLEVDKKIEELRMKSFDFLKNSLKEDEK